MTVPAVAHSSIKFETPDLKEQEYWLCFLDVGRFLWWEEMINVEFFMFPELHF